MILAIAGYYRVNYDSQNWNLLTQQLIKNHSAISVINRAQILDDALKFAEAGHLDYETALNLTRYLERETDYVPWDAALSNLNYISSMMMRTSGYGYLKVHKISFHLYFSYFFTITVTFFWHGFGYRNISSRSLLLSTI